MNGMLKTGNYPNNNRLVLTTTLDRKDKWKDATSLFTHVVILNTSNQSELEKQVNHLLRTFATNHVVFVDVPKNILMIKDTSILKMFNIYRMIESTSPAFAIEFIMFVKKLIDNKIEFEMDQYYHQAMRLLLKPKSGLSIVELIFKEVSEDKGKLVNVQLKIKHTKHLPSPNDTLIAYADHYLTYEQVSEYQKDIFNLLEKDFILNEIDCFSQETLVSQGAFIGYRKNGKFIRLIKQALESEYQSDFVYRFKESEVK